MKNVLLLALLAASPAFATNGNSDVGSSTFSVKCVATAQSIENVKLQIKADLKRDGDYARPASIKVAGLHDSFMNVTTDKAMFIANENGSMVIVPLKNKGDGQLVIVFTDETNSRASVQYRNVGDEYSILAEVTCK